MNPEDSHLRTHRRENLKSYLLLEECLLDNGWPNMSTLWDDYFDIFQFLPGRGGVNFFLFILGHGIPHSNQFLSEIQIELFPNPKQIT
jgi:hypothetical protein